MKTITPNGVVFTNRRKGVSSYFLVCGLSETGSGMAIKPIQFPVTPFELSRLRGGRYAWVKLAAAVLRSNCLASVGVEV